MERDRTPSGSSGSWSLVDSDGSSEADIDVHSLEVSAYSESTLDDHSVNPKADSSPGTHHSRCESGRESSRGSQGTFDVPPTTDSESDAHVHDVDESEVDAEAELSDEDDEMDETQSESGTDQDSDDADTDERTADSTEMSNDEDDVILLNEEEAMEGESLRYVTPERVAKKLDILAFSSSAELDFFGFSVICNPRLTTVAVIALALSVFSAAGISHLIGTSWMNSKPTNVESFQYCEAPMHQLEGTSPGLPYREGATFDEADEPMQDEAQENSNKLPDDLEELRAELTKCQQDLDETRRALDAKTAITHFMRLEKRRQMIFEKELMAALKDRDVMVPIGGFDIPCDDTDGPCREPTLMGPAPKPSTSNKAPMPEVDNTSFTGNFSFCKASDKLKDISRSVLDAVSSFTNQTIGDMLNQSHLKSFDRVRNWFKKRSFLTKPWSAAREGVRNALMELPKIDLFSNVPNVVKNVKTSWNKRVKKYVSNAQKNLSDFAKRRGALLRGIREKVANAVGAIGKWNNPKKVHQSGSDKVEDKQQSTPPVCERVEKAPRSVQSKPQGPPRQASKSTLAGPPKKPSWILKRDKERARLRGSGQTTTADRSQRSNDWILKRATQRAQLRRKLNDGFGTKHRSHDWLFQRSELRQKLRNTGGGRPSRKLHQKKSSDDWLLKRDAHRAAMRRDAGRGRA